jgi:hypothetical protein
MVLGGDFVAERAPHKPQTVRELQGIHGSLASCF